MKNISILTLGILSLTSFLTAEKVLAISSKDNINNSIVTNPLSLEEQAQKLYEDGQFQSSVAILQNAIKNYGEQGDIVGQVMAWRNLSLVYQKMGDLTQARRAITSSLKNINKIKDGKERQQILAQTLEVQGQIQLSMGNSQAALETWKRATDTYQKIGENTGSMRSKINQAQALQALGLYNQAVKTLVDSQNTLNQQQDTLIKAKALLSLGDVLRGIGQLDKSQIALEESLAIAQKLSSPTATTQALLSLGKTSTSQGNNTQKSLAYFQQVIETSPSSDFRIQGQLNQLELLLNNEQLSLAKQLIPQIQNSLTELPPTRTAVYSRISLARILLKLPPENYSPSWLSNELATAIKIAHKLEDKRGESYATGTLGNLYEKNQRYQEARELTEKALLISQSNNAPELSYQWQWQLGRIITAKAGTTKADRESAIAAYTQSVKTLKSIRTDIVAISSDAQFDFRERVEPVYRELVELLLEDSPSQEELKQAREVIESLQLAELDNFFRNACLDAKPVQIDQIDRTSAIFYTIVLKDRLEVIVALPDQTLYHHSEQLSQSEIEDHIEELRVKLARRSEIVFQKQMLGLSQKVYNWLIKPAEEKLQANKVKNLVFISDGLLRNIPMSVLYDGKQYLIEKYSIANAPSLQLIDPKALVREQIQVLGGGLSEARFGFPALPNVVSELERIKAQVPSSLLLKNDAFTDKQLEQKVNQNPYQVVHLATHGEFSSKAEDTFVLTWNEKLNVDDLNNLLRSDQKQIRPIELLVLSACKTAAGDKRATLGLAGMAVRAGARSTLASLWYVDDEATALLMTKFYQELSNNKHTKAEILRNAQLAILRDKNTKFSHPYYWSAFVLVGNWL
ncbi:CHAT domain-containing protein [Anabaena sphaerica FACHB-251]|uniref:CHAT domain-containing protein n=1 Tax=Anabaena sphaerica FACHB-251 TaxID=2692883 RepID=A0A926ZYL7_9NOST|nr:CHAT domain-containing protein [Anabaena sphaerica]MBD2292777.1 CHAT domain-containing protein [Anabaena sphaerica FACHB-251]